MKVLLVFVLILNGQQPQIIRQPMPDLETCISLLYANLSKPDPDMADMLARTGGLLDGSCTLQFTPTH